MKDVVERKEVEILRGILAVSRRNRLYDHIGHILKSAFVIPELIKQLQKISGILKALCFLYRVIRIVYPKSTVVNPLIGI